MNIKNICTCKCACCIVACIGVFTSNSVLVSVVDVGVNWKP